ncbi:hypothetical protein TNCT_225271 [Trichonephila clavata]|uniref:Uncharacterized protein n=1 Tax=Trichonephila clavata TaxID=2740835 RepID=A0A8X6IA79_TRICU|nr:hypothetical protein TNCT_225271 [Trichonephila clavata]
MCEQNHPDENEPHLQIEFTTGNHRQLPSFLDTTEQMFKYFEKVHSIHNLFEKRSHIQRSNMGAISIYREPLYTQLSIERKMGF